MIFTRGLGSLFILLALVTTVQAKHLGTFGATYSIVEKDALEEIRDKARTTNWERAFSREMWEKKLRAYRPSELKALPRAERENVFTVDLTYTLDFDIPDGKGGILYPKGYTFNPLDYVSFPNTLVFIDGSDPIQCGACGGAPKRKPFRGERNCNRYHFKIRKCV
jgi:conjugal transfer pilus assembly protein TraW